MELRIHIFFTVVASKMSMTSTEDIEKWFEGTQLYDGDDKEGALKSFAKVTQNSRILFNAGCCYLSINDVKAAAEVVR